MSRWCAASTRHARTATAPSSGRSSRRMLPGSTRLTLVDVLANDERAVAIVDWSATYRGRTMHGRELAHYEIRGGRIVEAWFYPWDKAASDAFFAPDGE